MFRSVLLLILLQKKLVLSSTDDFDAMLSTKTETKKAKLLPDHIKPVEKRGKTLLDDTSTPVIKPQVKTYESKPLSNDAIKKAKLKEKALGKSEEDEPPTKKAKIPLSPKAGSSPPKGPVAEPEPEPEPVTAMETVKPENEPTEETDDVWRVPARAEEEFPMESSPGVSKKTGQAKKRVSWPAEGKLEQIRMFAKEEEVRSCRMLTQKAFSNTKEFCGCAAVRTEERKSSTLITENASRRRAIEGYCRMETASSSRSASRIYC